MISNAHLESTILASGGGVTRVQVLLAMRELYSSLMATSHSLRSGELIASWYCEGISLKNVLIMASNDARYASEEGGKPLLRRP